MMLFFLVSMALLFAYTTFFMPEPPEGGPTEEVATAEQTPATGSASEPSVAAAPTQDAAPERVVPERTVTLHRPEVVYEIRSHGGGLSSALLQGEKMREQRRVNFRQGLQALMGNPPEPAPQMNVAQPPPGGPLPLAISIEGDAPLPTTAPYLLEELENGQGVAMEAVENGWKVEKRLRFEPEGFEFSYELVITNTTGSTRKGELALHWTRAIDPEFEEAPSLLGSVGNQSRVSCFVNEDQETLLPGDEDGPVRHNGAIRYFGIDQQYFTSQLFFLQGAREGSCELEATSTLRRIKAGFPLEVGAGESVTYRLGGFAGPKDGDLLAVVPSAGTAALVGIDPGQTPKAGLDELIDFGILVVLCKLLLAILKSAFAIFGNWGIAIIAMTFLIKMLLLPLTYKQMVSAEQMKKLQPKMEQIRKKFADDKEKQQLEMMKMYQEAKVNPLAGCLPMLLQMPVWFALFTTLRNSFDIYGEPFFGPVWRDLTLKDPLYVLPVLLGVTMMITQRLAPQAMDAAQARIMNWVMPIVFTFFLLNYPAGLTLYVFTNNVMSIAQQYAIRKWLAYKAA